MQPELARTLKRIAQNGANEFYEGETAQKLADAMARNGGLITLADLKNYKAVERAPLTGTYRGYGIITAPPPSSGGVGILQMLGMLEGSGYEKAGSGSAAEIHYLAEVMRRYYADRSQYLGDPDFVKVPLTGLLDPAYIAAAPRQHRSGARHAQRADPARQARAAAKAARPRITTSSMREGNAVAVTYTLNGGYGNGITVPGLGFLLNNEMDDFAAKPGSPNMFGLMQGEANAIQPGKRPLSSMTPTIVLRDGKFFMAAGRARRLAHHHRRAAGDPQRDRFRHERPGCGGRAALPSSMAAGQAVPGAGISPDTVALLKRAAMTSTMRPASVLARVEAIVSDGGWLQGGSDGRGVGQGRRILNTKMQRALSTHLFVNHRLTTVWLDRIWHAGIPLVEIFCARQHLDYRDKAQIAELGHWFRDSELKLHSLHSPMYTDDVWGRSGRMSIITITEPVKSKRLDMVDEIKRALEIAETVPFRYLIQHLGVAGEEFDERKIDAAFSALEEINLFARQRGVEVLLENTPNELSSAERLLMFLDVTHLNLNCVLRCGPRPHARRRRERVSTAEAAHPLDARARQQRQRTIRTCFRWSRRRNHRLEAAPWTCCARRDGQYPLLLELREVHEMAASARISASNVSSIWKD